MYEKKRLFCVFLWNLEVTYTFRSVTHWSSYQSLKGRQLL